jgi:hypothetical protein
MPRSLGRRTLGETVDKEAPMKARNRGKTAHGTAFDPFRALTLHLSGAKRIAAVGQALALVALARKIGLRRGRRIAALAVDAYLAHEAFKRRPRHEH